MLSASSRITILCRPGGSVTFFCANILMRFRTTSIPRSSLAFSSSTASFTKGPSSWLAMHRMLVVFPVPGEPASRRFGTLPCSAITLSRFTASPFPMTSLMSFGRYFSTHGMSKAGPAAACGCFAEPLPSLPLEVVVVVAVARPSFSPESFSAPPKLRFFPFPLLSCGSCGWIPTPAAATGGILSHPLLFPSSLSSTRLVCPPVSVEATEVGLAPPLL
mmetsp:Transcript_25085/g.53786  ORF Transcript_25085/g.53786 Transcript_25085/m.53786 type:complete len:218 (+) Transcript_25085:1014-1667(+)